MKRIWVASGDQGDATGEQLQYMPQLDGLRALAVLFVIYSHYVPKQYHGMVEWGVLGVQLFFVLSGFLITGILLKVRDGVDSVASRRFALKGFYARRFLRIFPLYYVVVFAVTIFGIHLARETFWYNVTYSSNIYYFLKQEWTGPCVPFWSLAMEEQFYCVWPWIILYVPPKYLMRVVVMIAAWAVVARIIVNVIRPDLQLVVFFPLAACDALGGGALLAMTAARVNQRKAAVLICSLFGVLLWSLTHCITLGERWGALWSGLTHTAIVMICIGVVGYLAGGGPSILPRLLSKPFIVGIGVISYGLYVMHNFAFILAFKIMSWAGVAQLWESSLWARLMGSLTLLLLMASASWFFFEKPINRLKMYFPYMKSRG